MATKKIEIRPKGTGDYADILYPKTSADMVIDEASGTTAATHIADTTKHITSAERTAWNGAVTDIGTKSSLQTTAKNDLVSAINETFQNANNGKTSIANVVGSPTLSSDTFTKMSNDIQTQKNNLATNLTNKGQSSTGSETLKSLVDKVPNISLGATIKSRQKGSFVPSTNGTATGIGNFYYIDIPITSVDAGNSIILISLNGYYYSSADSSFYGRFYSGGVVNSGQASTIRLFRQANSSITPSVYWEVIEFQNLKSFSTGTYNANTDTFQTINLPTALTNVNKALIFVNYSFGATSAWTTTTGTNVLSTTQIQVKVPYNSGWTTTATWYCVELP